MVSDDSQAVFEATLGRLLDAGAPFQDAFWAAVVASWRGADEDVVLVPAGCDSVSCVCGRSFRFRPGATRARCPGCGARYEQQDLDKSHCS